MGLTDYLGKKRRLMIVKEVEFGVYLGNKYDKVLLPKKQKVMKFWLHFTWTSPEDFVQR